MIASYVSYCEQDTESQALILKFLYLFFENINIKLMDRNAIPAKNGIVINPSPLIYSDEHGTPCVHGLMSANPGTFCSK